LSSFKWLALGLAVLPAGLAAGYPAFKAGFYGRLLAIMGVGYFLFNLFFLDIAYPVLYAQNPVSILGAPFEDGKSPVIAYKAFNPAFLFRQRNDALQVPVFSTPGDLNKYGNANAERAGGRIFLVTRAEYLPEVDTALWQPVGLRRDLFELPTTVVLKWRH
jgi:hypothetical protein